MRIAVNRRALEVNRRIADTALHHPPIIIEDDAGNVGCSYDFALPRNREWRVVYRPNTPWIEVMEDDGEPISFNIWITDGKD